MNPYIPSFQIVNMFIKNINTMMLWGFELKNVKIGILQVGVTNEYITLKRCDFHNEQTRINHA